MSVRSIDMVVTTIDCARFLVLYGQFWPPGMDALSDNCKWYQNACINVVVSVSIYGGVIWSFYLK